MQLFNRSVSIAVGSLDATDARLIEELHVVFKVVKTLNKGQNTCKVDIFNASESTRNVVVAGKAKVAITAGYVGDTRLIFKGDIVRTLYERKPPDTIFTIDGMDGRTKSFNRVSVGYPPGTSAKQILADIAKQHGFSSSIDSIPDKVYEQGFASQGPVKEILEEVTKYLGVNWTFQNDDLSYSVNNVSSNSEVFVLSPETGLIESPSFSTNVDTVKQADAGILPKVEKQKGKSGKRTRSFTKAKVVNHNGWKIKCLLNPAFEPGHKIVIKSAQNIDNNVFNIISVEHDGDNFADSWFTTLNVKENKAYTYG